MQALRLAAMNDIGSTEHLGRRWHCQLPARLVLSIVGQGAQLSKLPLRVPLVGVGVTLHTDAANKTHGVNANLVRDLSAESVLEGGSWVDAVQMRSLLQPLLMGYADASLADAG